MPKQLFTSETAAQYGRNGREAQLALNGAPMPDIRVVRARLQDLISMIRREGDKPEPSSRVLDELSRAYERLFKVWAYLCGLPGPGMRRPAPERSAKRITYAIDPVAIAPTVVQDTEQVSSSLPAELLEPDPLPQSVAQVLQPSDGEAPNSDKSPMNTG